MRKHERFGLATMCRQALALVVTVLVIVGCRGKEGQQIVLHLSTSETDVASQKMYRHIIAQFEASHPGVRIELEPIPAGGETKVLIAKFLARAPVDIVQVQNAHIYEFAQAGYLLELDSIVASIGAEDFVSGSRARLLDHDYAIPYAGSTTVLWVRTDLFEKAGLELPKTHADLIAAAEALTQDTDGDGEIDQHGILLPASSNLVTELRFSMFLWQNGGDLYDTQLNVMADAPAGREALEEYVTLCRSAPPGIGSFGWYENIDIFLEGHVAMTYYAGRLGPRMAQQRPDLDPVVQAIVPPSDRAEVVEGNYDYYAIGQTCRHPELAKEFLEFLVTGRRSLDFCMSVPGHLIPPLQSVMSLLDTYDGPNEAYVKTHREEIALLFGLMPRAYCWGTNMGSMATGTFHPTHTITPIGGVIQGERPPGAELINAVVIGNQPHAQAFDEYLRALGAAASGAKTDLETTGAGR